LNDGHFQLICESFYQKLLNEKEVLDPEQRVWTN
jgi:hypothetical protein